MNESPERARVALCGIEIENEILRSRRHSREEVFEFGEDYRPFAQASRAE